MRGDARMTPILILAAGKSSRMRGADKLLEHIRATADRAAGAHGAGNGHPVYKFARARSPARQALTQHK